jgi:hypothetical protein
MASLNSRPHALNAAGKAQLVRGSRGRRQQYGCSDVSRAFPSATSVAGYPLHHSIPLKRLDQCHTGVHLSQVASKARAASGLAASTSQAEPLQRKVSHILVKPDQEHILDEIEERLAGLKGWNEVNVPE